ncbi:FAD-dependent oxidoreductase [Psychromarinibacter sp. C21-152]|uniref:FAD-dependent oxidoreductase n=1 Tax=Psychromarinibacter sediminicola TaxID=3033385 RepID=A0AAE3NVN2_9RHOB|nr:FAD-dependent oxidoreductase [Psychromarinibacter sediminicola]MDF0603126.1 FAD-dependent oxidoreductase [Psychromarinibacter sediminicola]
MLNTYQFPEFEYVQSPEQIAGQVLRHPVVVVGAGPVGLTAALDFAARGLKVVVLDDSDTVSVGSRAVCYAKRPLEIWDRLGVADRMLDKGIGWKQGRVFFRDREVYNFDLLPEEGHKIPAFINLQQYYLEEYMVEAARSNPLIDLRWKHKVVSLHRHDDHAELAVETPDGIFRMEADWVVACDGANSDIRNMVGAEFKGQFFQDRFLIADIVMKANFPTERWFWFDPDFHRGQSALLHKQSDDVWRLDFQLGWDADPKLEKQPERIIPRVKAMIGEDVEFELEWASVYQFACRRIDDFRYGRVLFAGDAAHQVSPFGARGANTGVQDIDNLGWKLAAVIRGDAPDSLIDSYHAERAYAADDNILNSTRSTDFITPKNTASRRFRDAALALSEQFEFARPLVNSGRLSVPTPYAQSPLNTPDDAAWAGRMAPGTCAADAPVKVRGEEAWLLELLGDGFTLLSFGPVPETVSRGALTPKILVAGEDFEDSAGLVAERYDGTPGSVYLIRPDQHVAARWRQFDADKVAQAIARAMGETT